MKIYYTSILCVVFEALVNAERYEELKAANISYRVADLIRISAEESRSLIITLNYIRFANEESCEYEHGYIMEQIIERYRKMVEIIKRNIDFHLEGLFSTLKGLELVQKLYFEIYHLVNMMHEIDLKCKSRKGPRKKVNNANTINQGLIDLQQNALNRIKQRKENQQAKAKERNQKIKDLLQETSAKTSKTTTKTTTTKTTTTKTATSTTTTTSPLTTESSEEESDETGPPTERSQESEDENSNEKQQTDEPDQERIVVDNTENIKGDETGNMNEDDTGNKKNDSTIQNKDNNNKHTKQIKDDNTGHTQINGDKIDKPTKSTEKTKSTSNSISSTTTKKKKKKKSKKTSPTTVTDITTEPLETTMTASFVDAVLTNPKKVYVPWKIDYGWEIEYEWR